jgi:aminoglycoside phosphotransferase family enzyme
LLDPQRYTHTVPAVELVQTHISWVLLAGAFAYKIKKPLHLPFLDFSTLAQRKAACLDELRLNRRYAPELYLDVVALFNSEQAPRFDGPGEAIEYAVRMRRFDEAGRLDRVCARGELRPAHLSALAATLTAFHETAARAGATPGLAGLDASAAPTADASEATLEVLERQIRTVEPLGADEPMATEQSQ